MLDVALVMPVCNEEACIADVVHSWHRLLSSLNVEFQMIVLNDGSRDGTREALSAFANEQRIRVVNKPNSGHGPTILMGYREAVDLAEWVFQCDSDDEMKADHFPELWRVRDRYDAVFGFRQGRHQNVARKVISACSRLTVHLLFGMAVTDVNTPYRLMRARSIREIIAALPDDSFAPNVIISGALASSGARICNCPVPHEGRRTGSVSIVKWKLWKAALKSFRQTLQCRRSFRRKNRPRA